MSLARVVRAARPVLLLALLVLAGTLPACGPDASSAHDGESWPMSVEAPAVLGYVALRADPGRLAHWLGDQIGWTPAGLSGARPACALMLDASVMGGDTALCLPVDDEDAFRASLEHCDRVEVLSDGHFELHIAPDHPLAMAQRALRNVGQSGMSPGAILSALQEPQEYVVPIDVVFHEGFALLVPTYEASVVTRRALDELAGLWRDEPFAVVVNADVQRLAQTFHKEIESFAAQLRNAQLGAGAAGAAAMFAQGRDGHGAMGGMPELPVSGAFLWELLGALRLDELAALQFRIEGPAYAAVLSSVLDGLLADADPTEAAPAASPAAPESERAFGASLRIRWTPGSDWRGLVDALRPAPELEGAPLVFAVDGERFASALTRFVQPLADYVKGEGPPADRFAQQLGDLLRPWSGLLAVFGDDDGNVVSGLSLREGASFDVDAARAWLKTLADAAGWKGAAFWEADPEALAAEGGLQFMTFDGALLLARPDELGRAGDLARALHEAAGAWTSADGPALRVESGAAGSIEARGEDGDLVLRGSWLAGER
ncbi:MAG: hypothetical protein H6825_00765 [Planctomycetes bacterium]|nr:hypothetical protein [Planctomycetota bacterium]